MAGVGLAPRRPVGAKDVGDLQASPVVSPGSAGLTSEGAAVIRAAAVAMIAAMVGAAAVAAVAVPAAVIVAVAYPP